MSQTCVDMPVYELQQGEVYIAKHPVLVTTLLGSCVSVCLFSRVHGVGAICHALLPLQANRHCPNNLRYVECAVEEMLRGMGLLGIHHEDIEAKIFGGGRMFPAADGYCALSKDIGSQNVRAAREKLSALKVKIVAERVGGPVGIRLVFNSGTGDVLVKRIGAHGRTAGAHIKEVFGR